jgi:hypothetical protein
MRLPDCTQLHWPRSRNLRCLIEYGDRRRRRAMEGLRALGIEPSDGWDQ